MKYLLNTRLLSGVKIGCAFVFVGTLLFYLKPAHLWRMLLQIELETICLAILLGVIGILVQWIKWQRLLRLHRPHTTWGDALHSLLIGFALGLVSPGRLGELGRGIFLGGDRAAWMGLAGVDRISSFVITTGAAWLGLWMLYPPGALGLLVLLVCSGSLVLSAGQKDWKAADKWRFLGRAWTVLKNTPRTLWADILAWSALFNLIFFLQFYLLVRNGGTVATEAIWGIPLIFGLKAVLPLAFLDLGVREGAAVLVFSRLELDPAQAFNAALLLFFINVLIPGLIGLVLVYRQVAVRWSRKEESTQFVAM